MQLTGDCLLQRTERVGIYGCFTRRKVCSCGYVGEGTRAEVGEQVDGLKTKEMNVHPRELSGSLQWCQAYLLNALNSQTPTDYQCSEKSSTQEMYCKSFATRVCNLDPSAMNLPYQEKK